MDNVTYDISKLSDFSGFDAQSAMRNFVGVFSYFEALTKFVEESGQYFQTYTPSVVVYDPDTRGDFLAELDRIQRTLVSLGMLYAASELKELETSIEKFEPDSLSDGIQRFGAEMDILAKQITSARIAGERPLAEEEKPVIIAVDDRPEMLSVITSFLREKYKVIALTDGEKAIEAAQSRSPSLFLLDIEMPIISGYELAERIRASENFKEVPIIFLTGKDAPEDVITAIKVGAIDYILKPVDRDLLLSKIERHLKPR